MTKTKRKHTTTSLIPRLSWEGKEMKESLVTTACACTKISVFYPRAIRIRIGRGLVDHVIIYFASQARASAQKRLRHNKRSFKEPKNQRMLKFPY